MSEECVRCLVFFTTCACSSNFRRELQILLHEKVRAWTFDGSSRAERTAAIRNLEVLLDDTLGLTATTTGHRATTDKMVCISLQLYAF